jgi:hypothetical protein
VNGAIGMKRRGSPLMVLGLLVVAWAGGRAAVWENPFAILDNPLPALLADGDAKAVSPIDQYRSEPAAVAAETQNNAAPRLASFAGYAAVASPPAKANGFAAGGRIAGSYPYALAPRIAAGHQLLLNTALSYFPVTARADQEIGATPWQPPFAAPKSPQPTSLSGVGRWSLDAWAFWRQGSSSTAISQGRVPIYGASQIGANLQFRLAPNSAQDPRLYLRSYRALVSGGESEVAAGVSARPFSRMPVRAQAEVRVTDNRFNTEVRPAAYLVTELGQQSLPGGLVAEAYGQGGWVGGDNATAFADGQLAVTREMVQFDLADGKPARFSIGAGAWGGAQKDATRIDLGPTMRLDLTIGKVPARLSVDWREQVAGDAAPGSGIAATLSTRF